MVVGEAYQARLGPEGRLPGGGVLSSVPGGASKSQPGGEERWEFQAEGTERQRLSRERNVASLGLGASIIANTQEISLERWAGVSEEVSQEEHVD